ncbi:glycosyltransferase family 4 protein [Alkalihalobacillus hemicellulosilyticus]|uniref:Lipopolysaccharide 1,2-N-acetylglucosaminetransferase n=1 Tax=Halalkalibacter hemicellulosilyticusJCM 9152 TaxID=1236971 RepID=W4QHQ4_9BACI|nr:glycosyltransferase family 4 protein [Halalkalibacter hemicellulosilyticus]GAE31650.1 lipopolysaccharide 1,2-N-acetylglucosaminetransferase [Halalkalibacter hemicellulosilyticusJCM 9152]
MKILLICTEKLPVPPIRGGAIQTYISGVINLIKQGNDLTVLGTTDPSLAEDEIVDSVRYVRKQGGLLETYMKGVTDFLINHSNEFDIIHIFNRPRLVLPVREVCPNAKLVLSMHNDMFLPEKINPDEAKKAIQELSQIITISNYVGDTIAASFPEVESKRTTIYSGVDLDRFVPPESPLAKQMRREIREQYDLQGKKVILFAGRLSANKGADILVRAMPELAKKHSDIALVIVGSKWFSQNDISDYIAYVRALAARLPIPVINTGFISHSEIHRWFAAADVFVCPSQWQEPLARVHYEAMASGLPIVTTARGGNPEVIILMKMGS